MITANIYQIAVLIIALAFLILVIFMIPTLLQLKRTVKSFEELSAEGKKSLGAINGILEKAGEQTGEVAELFNKVKEVGLKITTLAEFFVDNLRSPLISVLSLMLGIEFGLKHLKKKGKEGGGEDVKREE
ncbi:MAG: hypothetical protein BMS9Abin23_0225 [Thermodesulfobacteriota bacterium]|nr:MAG: hypothetical protein BMS9Abin23_0225 [Thermodesulfobacteriota bacterium]